MDPVPDKKPDYLATTAPEVDFALVLARVIDAVNSDPAELRNAIYELARTKLQREAWHYDPPIDIGQMQRLSKALETAIERVEALSSRRDETRALQSLDRLIRGPDRSPAYLPGDPETLLLEGATDAAADASVPHLSNSPTGEWATDIGSSPPYGREAIAAAEGVDPSPAAPRYPIWQSFRVMLARGGTLAMGWPVSGASVLARTVVVLACVLGLMLLISPRVLHQSTSSATAALPAAPPEIPVDVAVTVTPKIEAPAQTLPSSYGVYAISNDKLFELEALPGRAPDPRIALSAMITKESHTSLPDGHMSFIAYRRAFATRAPDRTSVRVIAKITRAMSFGPERQAQLSAVDDTWAIRNISYEMRVAPVPSNPEMIAIRPEADLVLPAGRYGLVLDGTIYDFTVAGDVIEPAQCLERVAAANGTFYSECRKR